MGYKHLAFSLRYVTYVHYALLSGCSGVHFLVPMSRGAVIDFVVTYLLAVQVSVRVGEGGRRGAVAGDGTIPRRPSQIYAPAAGQVRTVEGTVQELSESQ